MLKCVHPFACAPRSCTSKVTRRRKTVLLGVLGRRPFQPRWRQRHPWPWDTPLLIIPCQIKTCGVSGRMPANLRHKLASLKVRSSSPSPGITARVTPRVERKVLVHPRRRQGMEAKPCNQPASHKPKSIISHSISGAKSQCQSHKETPY